MCVCKSVYVCLSVCAHVCECERERAHVCVLHYSPSEHTQEKKKLLSTDNHQLFYSPFVSVSQSFTVQESIGLLSIHKMNWIIISAPAAVHTSSERPVKSKSQALLRQAQQQESQQ